MPSVPCRRNDFVRVVRSWALSFAMFSSAIAVHGTAGLMQARGVVTTCRDGQHASMFAAGRHKRIAGPAAADPSAGKARISPRNRPQVLQCVRRSTRRACQPRQARRSICLVHRILCRRQTMPSSGKRQVRWFPRRRSHQRRWCFRRFIGVWGPAPVALPAL